MQVHTFNIGIYPGAILPFIIGYWADAATAVGDITATEEASGIEQIGPRHDERIQGCLLADGMPSDFCAWLQYAYFIVFSSSPLHECMSSVLLARDCRQSHVLAPPLSLTAGV